MLYKKNQHVGRLPYKQLITQEKNRNHIIDKIIVTLAPVSQNRTVTYRISRLLNK